MSHRDRTGVRDAISASSRLVRRHLPFLLLLAVLAWHGATSFGVYLHRDDFRWLRRTIADAERPWNIFVEPLFSNYYRPVVHAIWLFDYYAWGLEYGGYQLTLVAIWLGGVVLAYLVGLRFGGRWAGLVAAALLGLNNVHLMMVTWKSWVTALTEILLLLAWCACFAEWMRRGRVRDLACWAILAVLATLTKESAPLIISGGFLVCVVLPRLSGSSAAERPTGDGSVSWRGRWWPFAAWFGVTAGVLLLLPSYRAVLSSFLGGGEPLPLDAPREFSPGYVWRNWRSHTASIFGRGISVYLLLFAVLWQLWQLPVLRRRHPHRYATALLGAAVIGAILLTLPAAVVSHPLTVSALGKARATRLLADARAGAAAAMLAAFVVTALCGDRWDRLLATWFAAAMMPILPFRLASNGYHMLAFVALALYVGRHSMGFLETEGARAWHRLRGRAAPDAQDLPRWLLLGAFALIAAWQCWLLAGNFHFVHRERPPASLRGQPVATVPMYVERGRAWRRRVEMSVGAILRDPAPARVAYAGEGDLEGLAALELAMRHGFRVVPLTNVPEDAVGLRRFAAPLRLYTDVIRFDAALFARCGNVLPDPGFEESLPEKMRGTVARSGRFSLVARVEGESAQARVVSSEPLPARPGTALVFGGFLRCEAEALEKATMALDFGGDPPRRVRTPAVKGSGSHWKLVSECAVVPADARRFVFRTIEAIGLRRGSVFADDVFVCPVDALIAEARRSGGRSDR